jgi:hypothetical protein
MKYLKNIILFAVITLLLSTFMHCSKITGGLDDQAPVLIVKINTVGAITIDNAHKVYLIYFNDANWTTPWFTYGAASDTLFNPAVPTSTTYLAAYWDANGNTVLDTGDPVTGYNNKAYPNPMTKITFIPLEWRTITITLDATQTYP